MNKIYLPGLNGMRAIAALIVVIAHFTQIFGVLFGFSFSLYNEGGLAVTLFFTLSGYLITYLLLLEKEKFGTISLKAFYLRRILRIWPLYYLIIILGIVIMYFFYNQNLLNSADGNLTEIILYIIFAGNFVGAVHPVSIHESYSILVILWSLGVEEQFYLFWPLLLKVFKTPIKIFLFFLAGFAIIKIVIRLFFVDTILSPFISQTRLDCMAIGAIGAYLVLDKTLYKNYVRPFLFNKFVQIFAWVVFAIGFTIWLKPFSIFTEDLYSVFFTILLINVSKNENTIITLEAKLFNFLGRISYGIYMYHVSVMFILAKFIYKPPDTIFYYFLYLTIVILLTVLVAYLSNQYIESYFLKKKSLLSKIKTTN
jgi:peptidoglycan/LPS O-acetylase OafA/YrhL